MSSLVRRTNLLVSLKSVEGVDQVWKYGADAVTLNLRDVYSEALDQKARKWIRISIRFAAYGGAEVFAGVGGQRLDQELEAAVWPGVAGVAIYGAESAIDVIQASDKLEALERNRGISSGSLEVTQPPSTQTNLRPQFYPSSVFQNPGQPLRFRLQPLYLTFDHK